MKKTKCSDKNVLNRDEGTNVKTNTRTLLFAKKLENEINTKTWCQILQFVFRKYSLKTTSTNEIEILRFEIKNEISMLNDVTFFINLLILIMLAFKNCETFSIIFFNWNRAFRKTRTFSDNEELQIIWKTLADHSSHFSQHLTLSLTFI